MSELSPQGSPSNFAAIVGFDPARLSRATRSTATAKRLGRRHRPPTYRLIAKLRERRRALKRDDVFTPERRPFHFPDVRAVAPIFTEETVAGVCHRTLRAASVVGTCRVRRAAATTSLAVTPRSAHTRLHIVHGVCVNHIEVARAAPRLRQRKRKHEEIAPGLEHMVGLSDRLPLLSVRSPRRWLLPLTERVSKPIRYRRRASKRAGAYGPIGSTKTFCFASSSRKRRLLVVRLGAVDSRGWSSRPSRR